MALGGSEYSGILPENYHKIIPHINLGLGELHKRFLLKTGQVTIQQYDHIQQYFLDPRFAKSNTTSIEPYKYIMDSVYMPFDNADDVLAIENVFDENGIPYILNDSTNAYSVFTPSYNSVQVPFADGANVMTVEYRANHKKLTNKGDDVLAQRVDISITYLEGLLNYIAARYLSTIGTQESSADSINFMNRFEMSCAKILELNLAVRSNDSNEKLDMRGWV